MTENDFLGFLQSYLYFPLIVSIIGVIATAFLSYLFTNRLNKKNYENERRSKTIDLIDKFLIEFNKSKGILNTLRENLTSLNYFSFIILNLGKNTNWRLKNLTDSITLFDDILRLKVLETIDKVTSLLDEIDELEKNPVNEYRELVNNEKEFSKEYRDLTSKLLDKDIWVKEVKGKFECRYLSPDKKGKNITNDKELKVCESIRQDLLNSLHDKRKKLDDINLETTKKRNFYLIKLLDMENKINDLLINLNNYKEKLQDS